MRIETLHGTFRATDVTPIPDPLSGPSPDAMWSPTPEEPWFARPGLEYVDFLVQSNPGDDYRTLEVTWLERGIEMKLNIYLAADARRWWATEIWAYDGGVPPTGPHWIVYNGSGRPLPSGRIFESPRGKAWTGDLKLTGVAQGSSDVIGELEIAGIRLTAFP